MNQELKKWLEMNGPRNKEAIASCNTFAGIMTQNALEDPGVALQLGYALMLDKPIVLIVDKTMQVPASLVKIARLIERVDTKNPVDMERAGAAVTAFAQSLKNGDKQNG